MKRVGELDHITELRDAQRKNHEDLRKQRLDEFMKVLYFKARMLFGIESRNIFIPYAVCSGKVTWLFCIAGIFNHY